MPHSDTELPDRGHFRPANFLWYCPLVLAVLFSFYCAGATTLDSGHYIKRAFFFTQGDFDLLFRPGFILLLGSAFKILEPSVLAGTVLIRLFFAANVYIIFFITRFLYDKKVAFAASMALFTSYYLHFLSHRLLLDNVHPFFVLLAIYLSLKAVDRKSTYLAVAAGSAFFYAYLVKVTAVLFLPFPILIAVFWHSFKIRWSNLRQAFVTTGLFSVCIVVYQLITRNETKVTQAQHAFNKHASLTFDMLFGNNIADGISSAVNGYIGFWDRMLFADVWLGGLFAVSWLWLAIKSFKSNSSRAALAIFILFIPAAIYLGLRHLRIGQAGVFLFVTYIPVGVLLCDLAKGFVKIPFASLRIPDHLTKTVSSAIIILLSITVCIYQVWYAKPSGKKYLKETYIGRKITGEDTGYILKGAFDSKSQEAAQIINEHIQTGDIIITGFTNFWAIQFFTGYQYPVSRKRITRRLDKVYVLTPYFADSLPSKKIDGRLLFLWPNGWKHGLTHWNQFGELRFRYVDESSLLTSLRGEKTVFVVLDKRWAHIGSYLEKAPGVKKISRNQPIYRVKEISPVEEFGPPRVAAGVGKFLRKLRKVHPENYQVVRNKLFPDFFGFKPEQVDAMAELNSKKAGVIFINMELDGK